jgi:hypothetical protein
VIERIKQYEPEEVMNRWIYGNKRQIIECENAWW